MIGLHAHNWDVLIAPELGGAVLALRHRGRDILRPAISADAVAEDPREAACYPCAPWFGRLYDGLKVAGRHYDLAPTHPLCDADYPLHGEAWVNPWLVVERHPDRLSCIFEYAPKPAGFPFAFTARQDFSVRHDAFRISLTLVNQASAPMPAGLGLHPFFIRNADTRLDFEQPLDWRAPLSAPAEPPLFAQGGALPERPVDHSATGWRGNVAITSNDISIHMQSTAAIAHLYAPTGETFFCIEPVTHLPGKFGGDMLAPDQGMTLSLSISSPECIS